MKRIFGFVAVAAMVMAASMAFAAVQDFGDYTFDIPDGWTGSMQSPAENVEVVSFIKNDNTASGSVTFSATNGASMLRTSPIVRNSTKSDHTAIVNSGSGHGTNRCEPCAR